MTPNEIISARRGECRHTDHHYENGRYGGYYSCNNCNRTHNSNDYGDFFGDVTNYSTDLAAWDSDLYEWIEGEGLWGEFRDTLCNMLMSEYDIPANTEIGTIKTLFGILIKATPPQKAEALARAIEESE